MATAAASAKALGIEVVRLKALNLILKITASGAIASQVGARLLEKINQQMRGFSTIAGQPINSSRGIVNDSTDGRKTRFALSPG